MDWLTSIPRWQIFYIFLAAMIGFLLPFIILVASLPIKLGFGAIVVGFAYFFAESVLEWVFYTARDTFRKRGENDPKQEPITPYAHAKIAAFAVFCALGLPIALNN